MNELLEMCVDGGWVMAPLFLVAVMLYVTAAKLCLACAGRNFSDMSPDALAGWVREPDRSPSEVGRIIRYTQDAAASPGEVRNRFSEIRAAELPRIDRGIVFVDVLIVAAPLLGLLGTVLGMLATFDALAVQSGQTLDMIASGISAALITTETGLLIALPGYFLAQFIKRKRNEHSALLSRLESLTLQEMQQTAAPA